MAKTSPDHPGPYTRVLVLHGKEELLKQEHLQALRAAVEEAHGKSETFTFDGLTASLADVFDELRSYALMVSYKIVVVDHADEFVKTHREALERYAAKPVDHATLVLRGDTWNRGNLDKLIAKVGCLLKCEELSAAEARQWAIHRATTVHQRRLAPPAAAALVEHVGAGLMRLDNEIAKLALLTEDRGIIDEKLVHEVVGRSSDEKVWAVQEAVLTSIIAGDGGGTAIHKIHEVVDLADEPDIVVSYFVADIIRKLHLGLMMKRQGQPEGVISRELKLWGPRQAQFFQALKKLQPHQVPRLFDRVVQLDGRAKSGFGNTMRNLECFCAQLADLA